MDLSKFNKKSLTYMCKFSYIVINYIKIKDFYE
jgi:hypothetical protein